MGLTTVLILAIGLAMDAFAVSISNAMCYRNMNRKWALLTAGEFGLFQGIMPVIGWLAGITFTKYIESIDHYIALVLLGFIGIKMIVEAIREIRHPEACDATKQLNLKMLGVQAVATSIDALAVGISFAAIHGELNIFCKRRHHLWDHLHLFSRWHPHWQKVRRTLRAESGNFRGVDSCAYRSEDFPGAYIGVNPMKNRKENSMEITYQDTDHFRQSDLQELFLSVEWSSGYYPDKLVTAMEHFETVYTAWDKNKLVGLICAMDDGVMTAYVHYLLVHPDYQHMGIGKKLVERIKDTYKDYLRIVLVAYNDEVGFYESCGFEKAADASPMFITELWT